MAAMSQLSEPISCSDAGAILTAGLPFWAVDEFCKVFWGDVILAFH